MNDPTRLLLGDSSRAADDDAISPLTPVGRAASTFDRPTAAGVGFEVDLDTEARVLLLTQATNRLQDALSVVRDEAKKESFRESFEDLDRASSPGQRSSVGSIGSVGSPNAKAKAADVLPYKLSKLGAVREQHAILGERCKEHAARRPSTSHVS